MLIVMILLISTFDIIITTFYIFDVLIDVFLLIVKNFPCIVVAYFLDHYKIQRAPITVYCCCYFLVNIIIFDIETYNIYIIN